MSRDRHNIMKIELIFKAHKTKENNRVARHLSPSGKPAVGEIRHSDPLNKSFLLSMKPTVDHIPTVPKAPAADVVGARPCSLLAANISVTVSRDQTSQPYSIDDKPNIFHVFVPQIGFRPPGRTPTFINKPVACFPFFCSSHNGNILMFLT